MLTLVLVLACALASYVYGVWWGYRKGSEHTRVIVDAEWAAIL